MSVAAIVLAAGASRRLGRAKQTVMVGGETLLERAVGVAAEAGLSPVIVVIRIGVVFRSDQCEVVVNAKAAEGMASSIRTGVKRAASLESEGAVLMTCDQVALQPEHLRQLCAESHRTTGSGYAGKIGIPAYFPAVCFKDLLELRGDVGAQELLRDAAIVTDESLVLDIDTEEDVQKAKYIFGDES